MKEYSWVQLDALFCSELSAQTKDGGCGGTNRFSKSELPT